MRKGRHGRGKGSGRSPPYGALVIIRRPRGASSMTTTETSPVRNGVDTEALFATINLVKVRPRARRLPVPGVEPLDERHPQPHLGQHLLRCETGVRAPLDLRGRQRPPGRADRLGPGPEPGRVPARRSGELPHRRAREHRRGARRHPPVGRVDGRGRHRPARESWASRPRFATATSRSGCRSASTPTRTRRPCGLSSSSRGPAPRSSTSSRTARPSRSTSTDGRLTPRPRLGARTSPQ